MGQPKIIERIEQRLGIPGLVTQLAERLAPTDLQSLLLEVYRQRVRQRRPAAVLADYERNRFVRPASISPVRLLEWERVAFAALPPDVQPIALSPVCPLGTCATVASIDQNWALSTVRNTEVVSDSTNVLALECAVRRRDLLRDNPKSIEPVHLAASHRLVRTQRYDNPKLLSHFSAFALCSGGRDQGHWQFELASIALHARFYFRALRAYLGPSVPLRLALTAFDPAVPQPQLDAQLLTLQAEFERAECVMDEQRTGGHGYYRDLCFHIYAATPSGQMIELADGGSVTWTQQLLSNAQERLVISGIGSERVCTEFGERGEDAG